MLRIIKIVTLKTYVQKALILNGFFLLAQPPGERERTIVPTNCVASYLRITVCMYVCMNSFFHNWYSDICSYKWL